MSVEDVFNDFLSDSQAGVSAAALGSDLIEDDIAAYDNFLAQAGREQQEDNLEGQGMPPVASLTTIPSSSQFSALSSDNSSTVALPGASTTLPLKAMKLEGGRTKPIPEINADRGYGDDFEGGDDDNDSDEYADDTEEVEEDENGDIFVKIGHMTLTKTQARLYGFRKSDRNPKFVVASKAKARSERPKIADRAAFRDNLARPVRRYDARDKKREFAKESEKANCTFVPTKSKAAVAAMKSGGCGYDFLDNLEKDDGFINRMDAFENYRRRKFRRDQERQIYNHGMDKKQCPNCGNEQSYDEWVDKRMQCINDRCNGKFTYQIINAFSMDRWEKRMGKSKQHAKKVLKQLAKETEDDRAATSNVVRTKIQEELVAKVSEKGKDFIQRMRSDIDAKENKLKEKNMKNDKVFQSQCPFEPQLNVDKKWLKNRDPAALYAQKERVVESPKKKKKVRAYVPPKKKTKKKKAEDESESEATGTRMGGNEKPVRGIITAKEAEEEDEKMRAKFEELLL